MKKILGGIMAAVLSVLALTGCGAEEEVEHINDIKEEFDSKSYSGMSDDDKAQYWADILTRAFRANTSTYYGDHIMSPVYAIRFSAYSKDADTSAEDVLGYAFCDVNSDGVPEILIYDNKLLDGFPTIDVYSFVDDYYGYFYDNGPESLIVHNDKIFNYVKDEDGVEYLKGSGFSIPEISYMIIKGNGSKVYTYVNSHVSNANFIDKDLTAEEIQDNINSWVGDVSLADFKAGAYEPLKFDVNYLFTDDKVGKERTERKQFKYDEIYPQFYEALKAWQASGNK